MFTGSEKKGRRITTAPAYSVSGTVETTRRLVVSYTGYRPDTLTIARIWNELKIIAPQQPVEGSYGHFRQRLPT